MLRLLAFLLLLVSFPGRAQQPATVIQQVNVVDVRSGRIMKEQTVVLQGRYITRIGRRVSPPAGAVVIDGRGKYLMPGLWDMHFHMRDNIDRGWEINETVSLPLMLANGVTGVRYMAGNAGLLDLRRKVESGQVLGPRLVVSTPILQGRPTKQKHHYYLSSPARARRAIDSLASLGYDLAKVYTCWPDPAVLQATAQACRRNRLPMAGHVPATLTAAQAVKLGFSSLEHLHGIREAYTSTEAALVAFNADVCITRRSLFKALDSITHQLVTHYDAKEGARLARLMKRRGAYATPTQVVVDNVALSDQADSLIQFHPHYARYTPPELQAQLRKEQAPVLEARTLVGAVKSENAFAEKVIRELHRQGVPLLIGTDAPIVALVPGFAVHDEMERLARIGVSSRAVLQAATLHPARQLGRSRELGQVAVGMLADLLLLNANPLEDVSHTRQLAAVVVNGRVLQQNELNRLLEEVQARSH